MTLESLLAAAAIAALTLMACEAWLRVPLRQALSLPLGTLRNVRSKSRRWLSRRLASAGIQVAPGAFALGTLLMASVVSASSAHYLNWPGLLILIVFLVAMSIPLQVVSEIGRLRTERFEEKLIPAIEILIAALTAGHTGSQALRVAAESAQKPAKRELAALATRLERGLGIRQALTPIAEVFDSESTRLFVQTLATKWETGGDLAPVLRRVNQVARERRQAASRLRAQLGGAHLTAVVGAALPYLMIPVLLWRKPEWVQILTDHPWGPSLFLLATGLQIFGFVWLRQLTHLNR